MYILFIHLNANNFRANEANELNGQVKENTRGNFDEMKEEKNAKNSLRSIYTMDCSVLKFDINVTAMDSKNITY